MVAIVLMLASSMTFSKTFFKANVSVNRSRN